jgi:hypothetical protein
MSGTTRLAASVGVEARTSAARSISGVSTSCPIAETIGVSAPATRRVSCSSEKGSRSSSEPPPREMMMTSTSSRASSSFSAAETSRTAFVPCTATSRISNCTAGQRRRALTTTSRSAADSRPQISPTTRGRKGSGFFRAAANRPSAASTRLSCSSRASSSPSPTGRMSSASSWRLPRLVQKLGLACTTTRAPGTGSTGRARSTCSRTGTEKDMSTSMSRRVMKLRPAPGRRFSCTISPSTHSGDIRATYSPTFTDSCRSGHGFSAVVCAAVAASGGRAPAAGAPVTSAPSPAPPGSGVVCVMGSTLPRPADIARTGRRRLWMSPSCGGLVTLAPRPAASGAGLLRWEA